MCLLHFDCPGVDGGCLVAPMSTGWFSLLERLFQRWDPSQLSTVICKMSCEQARFGTRRCLISAGQKLTGAFHCRVAGWEWGLLGL